VAFEFLDHTGDSAVRLVAADAAGLVEEAARALLALYVGESVALEGARSGPASTEAERPITLETPDPESLLVDFLSELIWRFDSEGFLCREVEVRDVVFGAPSRLDARLRGEFYDAGRHEVLTEVKAATYHGLCVEPTADGLRADMVFDL